VAGALLPTHLRPRWSPRSRGGSQINVYGLYTLVKNRLQFNTRLPTRQPAPQQHQWSERLQPGFRGGADFRLGRFVFGQPALGARYTYSTGNFGKQRPSWSGPNSITSTASFGLYGDFLIGPGDITYRNGVRPTNSIVYEFGGGVDYHKSRKLNFRIVDFQYQLWDLGNPLLSARLSSRTAWRYVDTKLSLTPSASV